MSPRAAPVKTVAGYIAALPGSQRADAQRLHKLIRKTAPTLKPFLSSGMVGYGPIHVPYESGREVDWFAVGVAGRKHGLALHVMPPADGSPMPEIGKDRFPKGDVGMSCVRFRKLDDLDEKAVVALVRAAVRARKTWRAE